MPDETVGSRSFRPLRFADTVKRALRQFGVEVRRYGVQTSSDAQLYRILTHLGVDLVVDVGAHEGQYALGLRSLNYVGRIVSFEPLSAAHARLVENSAGDPGWEVAPRMALGEVDGAVNLHVSGHSLSSSVLKMMPLHAEAVPGSETVGLERVPIARLDSVLLPYLRDARIVLLKIDTQGYENFVLRGATGVLAHVAAIQTELSLVPLYAGQLLFDDMRNRLNQLGFGLFALFPGHVHERTGQTLQVDGLFVRGDRGPSAF